MKTSRHFAFSFYVALDSSGFLWMTAHLNLGSSHFKDSTVTFGFCTEWTKSIAFLGLSEAGSIRPSHSVPSLVGRQTGADWDRPARHVYSSSLFTKMFIYLLTYWVSQRYVHITCESQRPSWRSQFSLPTLWVLVPNLVCQAWRQTEPPHL